MSTAPNDSPLLHAVAQIAAALATRDAPTEVLPGVLERIADTVDATSASLWMGTEASLHCDARIGRAAPSVAAVRAQLANPTASTGGLTVVRLGTGSHALGVIALTPSAPLTADQRTFLSTIADILSPVLRQTAYAHRLESEVDARTAEINRERIFTEKIIDSLPRRPVRDRSRVPHSGVESQARDGHAGCVARRGDRPHDLRDPAPPAARDAAPRVRRRVHHRANPGIPDGIARHRRAAHVPHLEDSDAPRRRPR